MQTIYHALAALNDLYYDVSCEEYQEALQMLEERIQRELPGFTIGHAIEIGTVGAGDAADVVRPAMEFLDHEEMRVLLLDTKHGVLANQLLYQGTVDSSVLRTAEIFRPAVTRKCPKVLIAHNHPSGDSEPS